MHNAALNEWRFDVEIIMCVTERAGEKPEAKVLSCKFSIYEESHGVTPLRRLSPGAADDDSPPP
jgi:hypothetical protein